MQPGYPPTRAELAALRSLLFQQIKEAKHIFAADKDAHELLTIRAAFKNIEMLMRRGKRKKQIVA